MMSVRFLEIEGEEKGGEILSKKKERKGGVGCSFEILNFPGKRGKEGGEGNFMPKV